MFHLRNPRKILRSQGWQALQHSGNSCSSAHHAWLQQSQPRRAISLHYGYASAQCLTFSKFGNPREVLRYVASLTSLINLPQRPNSQQAYTIGPTSPANVALKLQTLKASLSFHIPSIWRPDNCQVSRVSYKPRRYQSSKLT